MGQNDASLQVEEPHGRAQHQPRERPGCRAAGDGMVRHVLRHVWPRGGGPIRNALSRRGAHLRRTNRPPPPQDPLDLRTSLETMCQMSVPAVREPLKQSACVGAVCWEAHAARMWSKFWPAITCDKC